MIVVNSNNIEATETRDEIVGKRSVYRKSLIDAKDTGGFGILLVTFSPGARLNFHTHTFEQILYVTEGKGVVATEAEEHIVRPGAVIFIPPGEAHWHGATEDSSFSHIAIQKPGIQLAQ
jgi:quercetin dioxygenase-like cupin family protein